MVYYLKKKNFNAKQQFYIHSDAATQAVFLISERLIASTTVPSY